MKRQLATRLVLIGLVLSLLAAFPHPTAGTSLQHRAWNQAIQQLSEPGGYFDSDNLISNESSYLTVVGKLSELNIRGGAYIGVGPDQNFTYMVRIRPQLAIIIDIRRQNAVQHLMFKALMEIADTRLEFLSLLFARPVRKMSTREAEALGVEGLLNEVEAAKPDAVLYKRTLARLKKLIVERYGFPTTAEDLQGLEHIYESFFEGGPDIRYRSFGRMYQLRYPSYRELLLEKDLEGKYASYLAEESDYQWLRQFQKQNRLIPVVGDFAGPKAVRAIGEYVRSHSLNVSAFYVSNVEFYLWRYGTFDTFVSNLKALPIDQKSLIIRSYFGYGRNHPEQVFGYRMATLLQRIESLVSEHQNDPYRSYWELAVRNYVSVVPDSLRSTPVIP